MRVAVIGLVGSGKSSVSRLLHASLPGYELINADTWAHEIYANNDPTIVAALKQPNRPEYSMWLKDGRLDKHHIGMLFSRVVYEGFKNSHGLNVIVQKLAERIIADLKRQQNVIWEITAPTIWLLNEFDVVIEVVADEQIREHRAASRDAKRFNRAELDHECARIRKLSQYQLNQCQYPTRNLQLDQTICVTIANNHTEAHLSKRLSMLIPMFTMSKGA